MNFLYNDDERMMFVSKVLFFDYDGTLCSDTSHKVSPAVRKALHALKNKGYLLFLNTGRTNPIVEEDVRSLPFDGYLLGCGSYIEYHNKVLFQKYVDSSLKEEIVKWVEDAGIQAFFEGNKAIYRTDFSDQRMLDIVELHHQNGIHMPYVSELQDDFVKMFVCHQDETKAKEFEVFMSKHFHYIDRGYPFAEIILKGVSKASAIEYICDHLHLSLDDCYVFGDSSNDMPMFELVKNSALLSNEIEKGHRQMLEEMVMYVCSDADHDGLIEAFKKFKLL